VKLYVYEFRTRRVRRSGVAELHERYNPCSSPHVVAALVRKLTEGDAREHMFLICLDSHNKVLGFETVAIGFLDGVTVHPRELFRTAIVAPAAAIIIAHNHPSGNAKPSEEDKALTARIHKGGELLGIPLVDHVVVGEDSHFSFAQKRYFPFAQANTEPS